MGQHLLVDSNMIEASELEQFVARDPRNCAVLAIEVWFELYKQGSVDALNRGLEILGRYPDQLIVLRSSDEIMRLDPMVPFLVERVMFPDGGRAVAEMVLALGAGNASIEIEEQLRAKWDNAARDNEGKLEGAMDILASLPEMQDQMFNGAEVGIIRRNERYTHEMFGTIFSAAEQLWEAISVSLGLQWSDYRPARSATLQFRIALGIMIYLLWWISKGSQSRKKPEATRNDVLDLFLAAQATYFDGFLTKDAKASWIHANLERALGAYRQMRFD